MEPYFELWKTPEVEAMVTAGNEAFEESVSAANEAFGKIFETMTGQADVFSGAGSRVAAQYEELLEALRKSGSRRWQCSRRPAALEPSFQAGCKRNSRHHRMILMN